MRSAYRALFIGVLAFPGCMKPHFLQTGNSADLANFSVKFPLKIGTKSVSKFVVAYQKDGGEKQSQVLVVDEGNPGSLLNEKFELEPGKYSFTLEAFAGDKMIGASSKCKEEQQKTTVNFEEGDNELVLYVCEVETIPPHVTATPIGASARTPTSTPQPTRNSTSAPH